MLFTIAFIIVMFLTMILRSESMGVSPSALFVIVYASCVIAAIVILRQKLAFTMRPPSRVDQVNVLDWDWLRSRRLVIRVGCALWLIPMLYAVTVSSLSVHLPRPDVLLKILIIQVLIVGVAEELFFREAALSEWVDRPLTGLVIASLAFFIFHLPQGLSPALIACGVGVVYGMLRILGVNIFVIAALHGATNILYSSVFVIDFSQGHLSSYALYFFTACLILSGVAWSFCTYANTTEDKLSI